MDTIHAYKVWEVVGVAIGARSQTQTDRTRYLDQGALPFLEGPYRQSSDEAVNEGKCTRIKNITFGPILRKFSCTGGTSFEEPVI